jgi:methylphosphotriester-DNA--protein-cysteine methyltransferase
MSVTLTSIWCLPSCPNLAAQLVAAVIHQNDALWTPSGNRSALRPLPDRRGSKESGPFQKSAAASSVSEQSVGAAGRITALARVGISVPVGHKSVALDLP